MTRLHRKTCKLPSLCWTRFPLVPAQSNIRNIVFSTRWVELYALEAITIHCFSWFKHLLLEDYATVYSLLLFNLNWWKFLLPTDLFFHCTIGVTFNPTNLLLTWNTWIQSCQVYLLLWWWYFCTRKQITELESTSQSESLHLWQLNHHIWTIY